MSKLEFLISESNKNYLADQQALKNLLQTNSKIKLKGNNIFFNNIKFDFSLQTLENNRENESHYLMTIEINKPDDEENIEMLNNVLLQIEDFKKAFPNINISTIWNDVSLHYCCKSYPMIYRIENKMRKLINVFMTSKLSMNWADISLDEKLKKEIKSRVNSENNLLFSLEGLYLSQLEELLFTPKSNLNTIKHFYSELDKNKHSSIEKFIEEHKPKSMWEKYFSQCSDKNPDDFHWAEINEYRRKVAHNTTITKIEFYKNRQMLEEVEIILVDCINNIEKITILESDIETERETLLKGLLLLGGIVTIGALANYIKEVTNSAIEPDSAIVAETVSNSAIDNDIDDLPFNLTQAHSSTNAGISNNIKISPLGKINAKVTTNKFQEQLKQAAFTDKE